MFYKRILFTLFPLLLLTSPSQGQVVINEIMASNSTTISDEDGDYEDWIELYNLSDEPLPLKGFGLSDDYNEPFQWVFPDITIYPGEFLLVWASGKDRSLPGAPLHTSFSIAQAGEEVILTHFDGHLLDEHPPREIPSDISYGRYPDGSDNWYYFHHPTPGAPNDSQIIHELLEPVRFSHPSGFYQDSFFLELSHPDPNVTLFYTLNGSEPSASSIRYEEPVKIENKNGDPDVFSLIPTNFVTDTRHRWMPPAQPVRKATIIRVKAVKEEALTSIQSQTFFIFNEGKNPYDLPVISLITDPRNLFSDETGIYVPGNNYEPGKHETGNYYERGEEWEHPGSFEFFEPQGSPGFSQDVGIRIHGGYTRRFPMKSLRLYARGDYGVNRFYYQIFPDLDYQAYNRLLLRASGNDFGYTMFMDAAAQSLIRHFNVDTQAYRPSIVFLNGEYWGIHNIRERYDRHYLERVYGADPDQIDLLTGRYYHQEGDRIHYNEMVRFIDEKDLSVDEHYREVLTRMDIDNYLDYYSAQVYYGNNDWPQNNIDYWRSKNDYDPEAPKGLDGRWRWLLYDVDRSLGIGTTASFDMIDWITMRLNPRTNEEWPNLIFRNLLENEEFKRAFINRVSDHLNTAFTPERVRSVIDSLKNPLTGVIDEHIDRWQNHESRDNWERWVDGMNSYADERPGYVRQHLSDHFDLGDETLVSINVSSESMGYIRINTIDIKPETPGVPSQALPWSGIYYSGIPIELEAIAAEGHTFAHWKINDKILFQPKIQFLPEEGLAIEAFFSTAEGEGLIPTAFPLAHDNPYLFHQWAADTSAGTFPPGMAFVYMNDPSPRLNAQIKGLLTESYDLQSGTRINGLGNDGIAFINTGNQSENHPYPERRLGGILLALDTREIKKAKISWTAGTLLPNDQKYALRLQCRRGNQGDFFDLTRSDGTPVEYVRNNLSGHQSIMNPVLLPDTLMGQPYIQLFLRYYALCPDDTCSEEEEAAQLHISSLKITHTERDKPESPDGIFRLDQNYPNPFNEQTRFTFYLNRQGPVLLELYDLTGRKITTIFDTELAAGNHSIPYDASFLPSGVYLYRLQSKGNSQIRKMTLIR